MIVVVSENSTDSEGKGQVLSSSQQIGSSDKAISMTLKCFLIFKMLMPSGVWVAFKLKLVFGKSFVFKAHSVSICEYCT